MRWGASMAMLFFFCLFFAVGFVILGFGAHALWKSKQVETWPTTWGTWLERDFVEDSDSDGTTYRVVARYAYTVAGTDYMSERIAFGYTASSGHDMHRALYDRVMSGESVRVRYNPLDPAEAALAGGFNKSTLFLLIFGGVWTIFTLGMFLLMRLTGSADGGMLEQLLVR